MVKKGTGDSSPGTRAPTTSPTDSRTSPNPLNRKIGMSPMTSPTDNDPKNPVISPGDSRIPRPSPLALRRSASMRVRGERGYHSNFQSTGSPVSTPIQQYHQRHNPHSLHYQNEQFPAITENGVDSPRHRSLSLSLTPARPRSSHAAGDTSFLGDDSDVDSVKSYGSSCSTASACDHANFALNGTTWSGRSRKYVVHCTNHAGDNEYLTPTQRAARQIRRFQGLLNEAKKEIEEKDRELLRLTKEVVELRLYKASLNSPDDKTDSSDALTVRENNPFSPETPCKDLPDENELNSPRIPEKVLSGNTEVCELTASLADSGHFEEDSVHSKDSASGVTIPDVSTRIRKESIEPETSRPIAEKLSDDSRRQIVDHYESRIEEMHRRHVDELQEMKQKHNDKVESLLNQLSEVNTRYCEIRPSVDAAEAKVRELEDELEKTRTQLAEQKTIFDEQEERNKQMYLKMYSKGQEAARIEQADQIFEIARQAPAKVTVAELMQQLSVTQVELDNVKAMYRRIVESRNQGSLDPEITLQFLKSAIYYFLTDKENHHGHLNAIESILGFTDNEKLNIDKIYGTRK